MRGKVKKEKGQFHERGQTVNPPLFFFFSVINLSFHVLYFSLQVSIFSKKKTKSCKALQKSYKVTV